jgi:hypothetical protein
MALGGNDFGVRQQPPDGLLYGLAVVQVKGTRIWPKADHQHTLRLFSL